MLLPLLANLILSLFSACQNLQFLSPSFKSSAKFMAEEIGCEVEFVTYKVCSCCVANEVMPILLYTLPLFVMSHPLIIFLLNPFSRLI